MECKRPRSIPGLGRSPREGIGYPFQYSWASLVAQTVKNQPATQETWVRSLGWEDLLEEGMATHSSTLAWRIPMNRGADTVHGVAKSQTRLNDFTFLSIHFLYQLSHKGSCGSKNVGVGSLSLLQWIFPTQELNRGLLHCR